MIVANFIRNGLRFLAPLAIACTIYLYLFPIFNRCAFPTSSRDAQEAFDETKKLHWPYAVAGRNATGTKLAPFRFLTLGDPQLEGDTSIPTTINGFVPHLKTLVKRVTFKESHFSLRDRIRMILHDTIDFWFEDIPDIIESARKHIDLFGNDFYLAHIYRTVHWWTNPTHVTVLGDLLGSQWIDDAEFERRGNRYWHRTFKGAEKVPDDIARYPEQEYDTAGMLDGSEKEDVWRKRILNVAGNHDIGYAGDLTEERMERFERVFGKANYELRFELPVTDPELNATIVNDETNPDSRRLPPEIRIIIVNDMNLDTPAYSSKLQDDTYQFINSVISTSHGVDYKGTFTMILTHIPMYKPPGVCVDAPYFEFHNSWEGGGIKEQYLLSDDASRGFWEGVYGMNKNPAAAAQGLGRPGLMLNGHDHEGCDTYHYINQTNGTSIEDRTWEVARWADAVKNGLPKTPKLPGRREITVRSMMGDFGGNAGLLSMWFDFAKWEWQFEYAECALGRQHFWWFVHSLDFGVMVVTLLYGVLVALEAIGVDVDGRVRTAFGFAERRETNSMKTTNVKKDVDVVKVNGRVGIRP